MESEHKIKLSLLILFIFIIIGSGVYLALFETNGRKCLDSNNYYIKENNDTITCCIEYSTRDWGFVVNKGRCHNLTNMDVRYYEKIQNIDG